MFLKEIELENFKSFSRRLLLPILSGYTAITGPNGSGKSDTSDAVISSSAPRVPGSSGRAGPRISSTTGDDG